MDSFFKGIGCAVALILLKKNCDFNFKMEYIKKIPGDIFKKNGNNRSTSSRGKVSGIMGQLIIMTMINTMGTETM